MLGNGRQDIDRELVMCGLSTATNSTPLSINAAMKARLRDKRSSLAITNRAGAAN
jgi:hypothetical protein